MFPGQPLWQVNTQQLSALPVQGKAGICIMVINTSVLLVQDMVIK